MKSLKIIAAVAFVLLIADAYEYENPYNPANTLGQRNSNAFTHPKGVKDYGPCGSTLDLNTNNPAHPNTLGFYAGRFPDGSTNGAHNFAGVSFFAAQNFFSPAAILPASSILPRGGYASFYGNLIRDTENAKYFEYHPSLEWHPVNATAGNNIPGGIYIFDKYSKFIFPMRVNFERNNVEYQGVGYFVGNQSRGFVWDGERPLEVRAANYIEVLRCNPETSNFVGPLVRT